jgi:hypothetical protein
MGLARYVVGLAAVAAFAGTAEAQKKDRNLITREEIMASAQKDGDLHAAIRSLRPHFLAKPRGNRSMGIGGMSGSASPGAQGTRTTIGGDSGAEPLVYVNGNKLGELNLLKTILAADVFEVKYLDPTKAQEEFGPDAAGGAVIVQLVKGIKNP